MFPRSGQRDHTLRFSLGKNKVMAKKQAAKKSVSVVKRVVPKTVAEAEKVSGFVTKRSTAGSGVNPSSIQKAQPEIDVTLGSKQQIAIWKLMLEGTSNLLVNARAGTGKTHTMVEALKMMERAGKLPRYTTFAAFNKAIGNELKTKVPGSVRAGTLHSLGFSACKFAWPDAKPDEDKLYTILMEEFGGQPKREDRLIMTGVLRLASLVKNCLLGEVHTEDGQWYFNCVPEVLDQLCDRYDVDVEDDRPRAYQLVETIIEKGLQDDSTFDLDDMLWLPVVKGLRVFRANLLIVDEDQDLNACQHAFIQKAGARLVVVGDENQSIYGFRGADVESVPKLRVILAGMNRGSAELALTTSWRLPKSHAKYVQKVVPDIEAAPDAIEGVIEKKHHEVMRKELQLGDMVVCRTNAPLVNLAFWLIKNSKLPVRVQGRDIGGNLVRLIDSLVDNDNLVAFKVNLEAHYGKRMAKLRQKETAKNLRAITTLNDTYFMLKDFIENCSSVFEIKQQVRAMFVSPGEVDPSKYIRLGSVHQVKGLEAETVWVYGPEQMPHPMAKSSEDIQQEWNIWYVAHTRSKNRMFLTALPVPDEDEG